ncbi:DUF2968 domain-containing protein [Trinickia violacea]|uniref:DUF2968 domain-containing protein n=1 Tax=Trinickia violacea TaxID=2571746 RepID=A0A4P8INS5_9BURK|nr:DUF2968 domain-containing protein [Trinickia violacea]QCP49956.1 DUF2968 domain-containing protein [Trinickia violacea]
MIQISHLRGTALAALVMIGGIQGVHAQVNSNSNLAIPAASGSAADVAVASQASTNDPLPSATPVAAAVPATTTLTADEAKQSATGNVAELQQMIHGNDLVELRTAYNGSYGASLLFYGKEMTYYVALFEQKNFWRVIKTQDEGRAEAIYGDFARKSVQLADVEIRRTKLEAQKAYTDRLIALSQDRANRLQADLSIAHAQQKLVDDHQKETRDEAAALQAQKVQAQAQLREAQRAVAALQRENDAGLPRTH